MEKKNNNTPMDEIENKGALEGLILNPWILA